MLTAVQNSGLDLESFGFLVLFALGSLVGLLLGRRR
jgi:hypothetical protein